MRAFSFSLERSTRFKPSAADRPLVVDDTMVRDRLNRSMRRRMSDDLASLIRRACVTGHIQTAEKLLDVLRDLIEIELKQYPRGRRPDANMVAVLAAEISAAQGRRRAR
jgi:hypothetical protein